ncbi:MAG: hypothetical protein JKY56_16250 [Kofleriaceae bacterium]|nr:hypothetical protein [Kofleriaceae bacterium]
MNVLLIGAGAVGQAYGRHFHLGGAKVTFYVRPHYAEETRKGFAMYPLNTRKVAKGPVRFDDFNVVTSFSDAANTQWDFVVLCMSSTALRKGTWLDELVAVIGDATLVSLCPGLQDNEFVLARVSKERAVFGLIGLTSYPGPLEGESLPSPGMVYWIPPLAKMAFSGPDVRTKEVVKVLTAGGLASKQVEDTAASAAFAGPILQMVIIGLELVGWSFVSLRKNKPMMKKSYAAMRESFSIAEKRLGTKTPLALRLIRPWNLRLVLRLIPYIVPFDMERFFEKHFTKVGDQTEDNLETLTSLAKSENMSHEALLSLHEQLGALRAHANAV